MYGDCLLQVEGAPASTEYSGYESITLAVRGKPEEQIF
jgi:hypothetical protein